MTDVLWAAIIAAASTIVGGVSASVVSYFKEKRRLGLEKRREAYELAEKLYLQTYIFASHTPPDTYLQTVEQAHIMMTFYASPRAEEAFDKLSAAITKRIGDKEIPADEKEEAEKLREAFVSIARKDLGIRSANPSCRSNPPSHQQ